MNENVRDNRDKLINRINSLLEKPNLQYMDIILHKILTNQKSFIVDATQIKKDLAQVRELILKDNFIGTRAEDNSTILFSEGVNLTLIDFTGKERNACLYKNFYLMISSEQVDKTKENIIPRFLSIESVNNKLEAIKKLQVINNENRLKISTLEQLDDLTDDDFILKIDNKYYIVYQSDNEIKAIYVDDNVFFKEVDISTIKNFLSN